MIELLLVGGLAALTAYSKSQTFEGKLEKLQEDFKSGKLSPQDAQSNYQSLIQSELDKDSAGKTKLPKNIKQALENGLNYKELAGKVDPDTYDFLHHAYWFGDWDASKRK